MNACAAPGEVRRRLVWFLLVGGPYRPYHPDRTGLVPPVPVPAPDPLVPEVVPMSPGWGWAHPDAVAAVGTGLWERMNRTRLWDAPGRPLEDLKEFDRWLGGEQW